MKLPLLVSQDTLNLWKQILQVFKYLPMEPAARVAMNKKLEVLEHGLQGDAKGVYVYGGKDMYAIVKITAKAHIVPDDRPRLPIYASKLMAAQAADQNGYLGEEYKIVPCKTIYIL